MWPSVFSHRPHRGCPQAGPGLPAALCRVGGACGPPPDLTKKTNFIFPFIPHLHQRHHLKKDKKATCHILSVTP